MRDGKRHCHSHNEAKHLCRQLNFRQEFWQEVPNFSLVCHPDFNKILSPALLGGIKTNF
jgi:hypothetical protein